MTIRPSASVAARPPLMLSMTSWLKACRSAMADDAARRPQHAGAEDRQHVERDEVGMDAAGQDDDRRHHADVDDQLRLDQPRPAGMNPARARIDDGQRADGLEEVEGELARQALRAR